MVVNANTAGTVGEEEGLFALRPLAKQQRSYDRASGSIKIRGHRQSNPFGSAFVAERYGSPLEPTSKPP